MLSKLVTGNFLLKCQIEIISSCNLHCSFCYLGESYTKTHYSLKTADIKRITPELVKLGCFEISLSGGEPLLNKEFLPIIEYLFVNGFKITLYTNAVLLNKENINVILNRVSKVIVNVPLGDYKNSLFSSKEKIEKYFVKLRDLNQKVQAKIVLNKSNINFIDDFCDICEKYKIKHVISNELIGYNKSRYSENSNFNDIYYLSKFIEYNEKMDHIHSCSAGIDNISINAMGDVGPCSMIDIKWGNIKTQTIEEIFFSKKRENFLKRKNSLEQRCMNCEVKKYCYLWCLGDHYNNNHTFQLNKNICYLANKIMKLSQ